MPMIPLFLLAVALLLATTASRKPAEPRPGAAIEVLSPAR